MADQPPSTLDDLHTIVEIVGSVVTTLAIVVGGLWTYFNFIKGRTYRPRLESRIEARWIDGVGADHRLLHVRVTLHNIGASVVDLIEKGSGLWVCTLDPASVDHTSPVWIDRGVKAVFAEHAWIEPNEAVSDDLLVALPLDTADLCKLEMRLVGRRSARVGNIDHFSRRVTDGSSALDGPAEEET